MRVCLSGNGQGEIAQAIRVAISQHGWPYASPQWVRDSVVLEQTSANSDSADVAICTVGGMLIRHAEQVTEEELKRLYDGNYRFARAFIERHVAAMRRDQVRGKIFIIGSNAAWFGNVGAEDYAGFKAAMLSYCRLRGRAVRKDGIGIEYIAFGGVATAMWPKATAGADPELAKGIVPGDRQPLTASDVGETMALLLKLPARVVAQFALFVSVDYQ